MAKKAKKPTPRCLILDSGAVIGWARGGAAVDVVAQTEAVARLAGALLGRSGGKNTVDALVAAEAIAADADVLTADEDDLSTLLAAHRHLSVLAV